MDCVRLEIAGGVARLTLRDPGGANCLRLPVLRECLAALQAVQADANAGALVLRAEGPTFCVGADLKDLVACLAAPGGGEAALGREVTALLAEGGNPLVQALRTLRVPVVCAVQAAAVGGGVGLALACDVVLAARSAYFALPFVPKLGAVPDMGASWFLPRALGPARAVALALLGDKLPAAQAAEWGLIWRCVEDEALDAEATALALRLSRLPAGAILEARALFAASAANSLQTQLQLELERQSALASQPAFAEGVRAFGGRAR